MFGTPGWQELIVFGVIALLMFGKRLPEVMKSVGQGISEFKKGLNGIDKDVSHASRSSSERQTPALSSPPSPSIAEPVGRPHEE